MVQAGMAAAACPHKRERKLICFRDYAAAVRTMRLSDIVPGPLSLAMSVSCPSHHSFYPAPSPCARVSLCHILASSLGALFNVSVGCVLAQSCQPNSPSQPA